MPNIIYIENPGDAMADGTLGSLLRSATGDHQSDNILWESIIHFKVNKWKI